MIYAVCVLAGLTIGFTLGNFQCRYLFGLPPWKDEELWQQVEEVRQEQRLKGGKKAEK